MAVDNLNKTVTVYNLLTGKIIQTLSDSKRISSIAISKDGKFLASGHWDKTITIWDIESGVILGKLGGFLSRNGHETEVTALSFSYDGQLIASASSDGIMKIWNLRTGELIETVSAHLGTIKSLIFTPDDQSIISASSDHTIKVWE
ncbi:WD40 repeat domain-containing protein [Nodularia chucula]|uniref:WD40 repeat domain-containing protein n=1 Tax=Nodularia chucula TaxID=3093667 RepID=UPI0039C70D99